jgi:hypothetical protein
MENTINEFAPSPEIGQVKMKNPSEQPMAKAIGKKEIAEATQILQKYKTGKAHLEEKIIANEQWWKLRHWEQVRDKDKPFIPATAWLWNVIVSKHADMEDGYPEPSFLPREIGDKEEAEMLSSIVPVIYDQNDYHSTYSDCCWYKLKQGAAIYGIFWDGTKLNGLGDISIKKIDALSLFFEPGITDIQKSRNIFHTELIDNDIIKQRYPQLKDVTLGDDISVAKYLYDDSVDTSDKSTVIDWYYKKNVGGRTILHYVKFIGEHVLYASENETEPPTKPIIDPDTGMPAINPETGSEAVQVIGQAVAEVGWYAHGEYPFVVDSLFDIEGSPFGYGYTDICKDTQTSIDQLNSAIVKNALMASKRRYFISDSCGVNQQDFADWEKDIVGVTNLVSDENIREITVAPLSGTYVEILNNQVTMLKETSGNRDVNNGGTQTGVTAASALAVMAENGNKGSRDIISTTYVNQKKVAYQVIELIRQFYDTPRKFRILGERGAEQFVTYDNRGLVMQRQTDDFGRDMGYRLPVFDIEVAPQKASPYNKMSQNELALQFYNLQFFNPQNATQAVACLDMMDFDGKNDLIAKIQQNGTLLQQYQMLLQFALGMAQTYDPNMIPMLMQNAQMAGVGGGMPMPHSSDKKVEMVSTDVTGNVRPEEHPFVKKAREETQASTQPR